MHLGEDPPGVGPQFPQVVVLFGATGDLARRKLLPGLFHLASAGFIPGCRIIGVSLDELDADGFRAFAREALDEFSTPQGQRGRLGRVRRDACDYVPLAAGADALQGRGARRPRRRFGGESRRLHYLSVPPNAALSAVRLLAEAGLVERSRIIMEKPFGTDLASAVALNAKLHEVFAEEQIFRIDHFLGKEPAQNILAFRFANGLFEPIWNRNFIDHVQIDVPETLGLGTARRLLRGDRRVPRHGGDAPVPDPRVHGDGAADRAGAGADQRGEEQGLPQHAADRAERRGARPVHGLPRRSRASTRSPRPRPSSRCKCSIDNWRWAGVPFFLRTGKRLAEGQRIISIAFREPPKSMFPAGSGVGAQGPDHLTFDLADASKMSLSFYGKRPGPGMRLDKLSLQFAMHDTGLIGDVLEAYERLILDAMRGDHTLFTTAEGIERLWEVSTPLLEAPPPVRLYAPGLVGPERDPPARRAARLAPAVRARLARSRIEWAARPAAATLIREVRQPDERHVLQQHDGLAVLDLAAPDHGQRLGQRQLEHLDVLALVRVAAAGAVAIRLVVGGHEEVQLLGDRAGAHVRLEHLARRAHRVAGLLDGLAPHGLGRVVAVQQAGAGLDEHAVGAAVDEHREAELADQDDRAARRVEQQQRHAVAAVVGLAADHLQAAVAAAVLERRLAQQVPVVREHALLEDADLVVADVGAGIDVG